MGDLSVAVIQGVVEGLTEFIPVSSTGHLIIVGHLLGLTGPKAAAFDIVIQLGAILSVVALYYRKWWGMVCPEPGVRFAGINGLWLLFLTCLPAATLGFFIHDFIEDKLFGPLTVALALAVGAVLVKHRGGAACVIQRRSFAAVENAQLVGGDRLLGLDRLTIEQVGSLALSQQLVQHIAGLVPDFEEKFMHALSTTETYGLWDNMRLKGDERHKR